MSWTPVNSLMQSFILFSSFRHTPPLPPPLPPDPHDRSIGEGCWLDCSSWLLDVGIQLLFSLEEQSPRKVLSSLVTLRESLPPFDFVLRLPFGRPVVIETLSRSLILTSRFSDRADWNARDRSTS